MSTAIRLDDDLVSKAESTGKILNRSAPKQVEYWANLGRLIADNLSNNELFALMQGIAKIRIDLPETKPLDPDTVFAAVDQARESGQLAHTVSQASIQYQASPSHPGLLEQINPDGSRISGQFKAGIFTPADLKAMPR